MDIGVDREPETGLHAARVRADRLVDVFSDIGEFDDLRLQFLDLLRRQAEGRTAQVDVLAPGHLPFEAGRQLQQRGDTAVDDDLPFGREADTGDHFEDGGLAGTVAADQRDRFTGVHGKAHVVDGVLGLDVQVFDKYAGKPLTVAGVQFIPFGNVFEFDDGSHCFICHTIASLTVRPAFPCAGSCRTRDRAGT